MLLCAFLALMHFIDSFAPVFQVDAKHPRASITKARRMGVVADAKIAPAVHGAPEFLSSDFLFQIQMELH